MPAVERARRLVLERFRWTHGHADFADVFADAETLRALGPALAALCPDVDRVVAIEARAFVLAGLVARELGTGVVLARKEGSVHPGAETEVADTPDWRARHVALRISRRAIAAGDRLVLVDDWIETGSQATTAKRLVKRLGGDLVGVAVLVDQTTDEVRDRLRVSALLAAGDLPV